jgi:hypothetical protein
VAVVQNLNLALDLVAVTNEPVQLDIDIFHGDTRKLNVLASCTTDHITLDDPHRGWGVSCWRGMGDCY